MKNDILDPVIEHAGPLIISQDNKEIYIGILSLGAILYGPEEKMIEKSFKQAMNIIIELLGSNSTKIWEASSWLLSQISIFCPDLLYDHDIFNSVLGFTN